MNNKRSCKNLKVCEEMKHCKDFSRNDEDNIPIETIWKNEFTDLMNGLKNIGVQLNVIKEKVEELKKDRMFEKKQKIYASC